MTTERNAQGADVLAVMERAKMAAEFSGDVDTERERAEARAAVAELVEAAAVVAEDPTDYSARIRLRAALLPFQSEAES